MTHLNQHFANLHQHAQLVSKGISSEKALKLVAEQEPKLVVSQVYQAQINLISESLNSTLLQHINLLTPSTIDAVIKENRFEQWMLQLNQYKVPFKLTHIIHDVKLGWLIGFYDYITELQDLVVPLQCLSMDERMKLLQCIEKVI